MATTDHANTSLRLHTAPVSAQLRTTTQLDVDEYFGHQSTPAEELPPPEPLLENLTRSIIEVLAGARDLEQLGRWLSEDVYRHIVKRQVLASRARRLKGVTAQRPRIHIGRVHTCRPRPDVIEAVVIVHGRPRSRAVAIRLEGIDKRWRATAISVL